ncbi:redoxin domain-containing protein [Haloferula sp.]|uniref:redoxin domain-containing protein n=1 Tax=Haloferula sp. TaxID=2497595 RepID=UPI0032A0C64F
MIIRRPVSGRRSLGGIIALISLNFIILPAGMEAAPEGPVREAPVILKPDEHRVGRMIPDLSLKDHEGESRRLSELQQGRPLIIAMTSASCPISRKYGPVISKLERVCEDSGVALILLNPLQGEGGPSVQDWISQMRLRSPYFLDRKHVLSKSLGASSTAEVFLLDPKRTLIYRGAIDDQYGFGYSLDAPRSHYLLNALAEWKAGRAVSIAATTAPGCELDLEVAPGGAASVTYHNRISRIIQSHCLECHRDGGVGPFSLASPDDLLENAAMIRRVVKRGIMPPWFAAKLPDETHSPWINDRTLSKADREDLLNWLSSDHPMGDPADAPVPKAYPDEWSIGEPDLIVTMPERVEVKAEGTMPYVYQVAEHVVAKDRYIQAVQVRPEALESVHHVLVSLVPPKRKGSRKAADRKQDAFLGIYVPGSSALVYPDGYGRFIPAGSRFKFQLHYTPNGVKTSDLTSVGLVFSSKPVDHVVRVAEISNESFKIPPHAANHRVEAELDVPMDVKVLSFMPHMHLRGKAFRYELVEPDQSRSVLLEVPRYDFNWQLFYKYAEPRVIRRGSRIEVTGWFDNSAENPANPDPSQVVRFGEQTEEEMLIGYVEYVPLKRED